MKRFSALILFGLVFGTGAMPAAAHPLGNFTTNVHLGVAIEASDVSVRLIVDMAEIPTFREPLDADGDEVVSESELTDHAEAICRDQADQIDMVAANTPILLDVQQFFGELLPGESDLQTLRVECSYLGSLPPAANRLTVQNQVYADRTGWAEMVVTGGTAEGLGATSPSAFLTNYPDSAPLAERQAEISLGTGQSATPSPQSAEQAPPITERLAQGLTSTGSTGTLVALVAALGLGATHALAPGHGKTLMAAYLVGRRGRPRQAVGLGLAVAVSHTIGVAVLGLVTALASSAFQPETVYPWLTTGSALIVTGLGVALLVKALSGRSHHDHDHDHDHVPPTDLGWRSLAALGLAGGLVPSASAVVLLLGAVAIGKPWFGVALVFGFGVGMSIALVAAGLIALRVTTVGMDRLRRRIDVPARLVPIGAGLVVTAVGLFLAWDGVRTLL